MQKSKAAAQAATQAIHFLCSKSPLIAFHIIWIALVKQGSYSNVQVPSKVLQSVKHWNHLSFAKLPTWMKDNEFIKFYHR